MQPNIPTLVPPPQDDQQDNEQEKQWIIDQWYGGISDTEKQVVRTTYLLEKQYQFYFGQNINIMNDGGWVQLQRKASLDTPGGTLTSIPRWMVSGQPYNTNIYIYCANGDLFQRSSGGVYTKLFTVPNSQGNGLGVWNGYLYYTSNKAIGLYGALTSASPSRNDNYLTNGINDTTSTGIMPVNTDLPFVSIGHGNNIGKFDGTTWTPNQLTVPVNSYVRSFALANQMLTAAASTGAGTLNTNQGYAIFWDGSNYTYNVYATGPMAIDCLLNNKNRLLSVSGSNGVLYQNVSPFQGLMRFPKLLFNDNIQIHPGSVANYKGLAMFGVSASASSSKLVQGVYHWGNRNENYPEGMNLDFTISTGNTSNIAIGALLATGTQLFIGWQDNNTGTYGIDQVSDSGSFYTSGFVEGCIFDDMRPVDTKNLLTIKCSHLPLVSGETIQLAFKVNRAASYTLSTVNNTVGSTFTKLPIPQNFSSFTEAQAKVILGSGGSTTPTVTTLGAAYFPQLTQSQY
jgi:hypothetical protein